MDFFASLCFGAGVAGFAYTKLGRRVGYGNTANVWTVVGVVFVLVTIIFYTVLKFFLGV